MVSQRKIHVRKHESVLRGRLPCKTNYKKCFIFFNTQF